MKSCPKCDRIVDEEWDFCTYCGQELVHETSNAFAYDQLFELMKLEEARRSYLDSKASTYIGLLSIAVTILTAFGGALTIRGGQIQEIKNQQTVIPNFTIVIIYILYFFIVILFILGVIFAFRAYSTGSIKISRDLEFVFSWDEFQEKDKGRLIEFLAQKYGIDWVKAANIEKIDNDKTISISTEKNYLSLKHNDEKTEVILKIDDGRTDIFIAKMENSKLNIYNSETKNRMEKFAEKLCSLIPKRMLSFFQINEIDVFQGMDIDYIAIYSDIKLLEMRKNLIDHLKDIISTNYNLNNLKSNRIINAYRVTILGILLLLLLSLIVGVIGIGNP